MKIRELPSIHFDQRAAGSTVDTVILHSMYAPQAADPFSAAVCKEVLDSCTVSAHYLVDRGGKLWRLVPEELRAWHAGVSKMPLTNDQREGVNHFSIGIELIASKDSGYTAKQYESLSKLILKLHKQFPIKNILGHYHIAPDRKDDPWNFDWERLAGALESSVPAGTFVIAKE